MASPYGCKRRFITVVTSLNECMPRVLHAVSVKPSVPHTASVPPQAIARPGVGSGMSLIRFPATSTKEVSTMCFAALDSSVFARFGPSDINVDALCTLKMVARGIRVGRRRR